MTAATISASSAIPTAVEPKPARLITWEQFQRRYLSREDRWKYEWSNGIVDKTLRTMDQSQNRIFLLLNRFLQKTYSTLPGNLLPEVDTFFGGQYHRRPDISFFTNEQTARFGKENQVPRWVIEVISSTDQINNVHEKMEEYRSAGVEVVWQIFPKLKEVHVYRGEQMTICKGERLCSAAPVLPDLAMPAGQLFE